MKTAKSGEQMSVYRLIACMVSLPTMLACNSGTANNPMGTSASNTNKTQVIASFANGQSLERRALDANGGFVFDQWPYSQALGQQWTQVPQADGSTLLVNIASGKAMTATGEGSPLQEADISAGDAVKWQVSTQSDGRRSVIKHVQTGLCLEAGSNAASVGAAVHVATCNGQGTQTWVVQNLSTAAASQLVFQLVDNASSKLLRAASDGSLTLETSDGTLNEQWQLVNHDDGTMSVTNLGTSLTLQGLQGADSLGQPALAPTAAGQTWRMTGASSSQYAFMSANDGTCMVSSGAGVAQGPCVARGGWSVRVTSRGGGSAGTSGQPNTTVTGPNLVLPWDVNGPVIDDIMQGTLNDCWLLTALSTVVWTDPGFITKHVVANADGTYTVTIYDNAGKPWSHTMGYVNANLPYPPDTSQTLANQRTGSNARPIFWPSLYEQTFLAYAQANPGAFSTVNDQYLDTGKEDFGYQFITGANWYWLDYAAPASPTTDAFWTNLSYANNNIPVSVLSVSPPAGPSNLLADGIVGDHFYAVLKTAGTGSGRTVTLRNPWGSRAPNVTSAINLGGGVITLPYDVLVTEFFEIQRAQNISAPP